MKSESYFYNCSEEYIASISPTLLDEIIKIISKLPKRETQSEINKDLFWLFASNGWSYDTTPMGIAENPSEDLKISDITLQKLRSKNIREHCLTTTTLDAVWHADFAKFYNGKLVQIEAQFGKTESMFKDFCGFRIARFEKRLALGIEIVMLNPGKYFSHRKSSISGMAYFEIAKKTLPAIGLECPIWIIGIKE